MTETLPTRLETIRSRARERQQELESLRWMTPQRLASRFNLAVSTIRAIPFEDLPYKVFGTGAKKRRRYHPDAVAAFEASGKLPNRDAE